MVIIDLWCRIQSNSLIKFIRTYINYILISVNWDFKQTNQGMGTSCSNPQPLQGINNNQIVHNDIQENIQNQKSTITNASPHCFLRSQEIKKSQTQLELSVRNKYIQNEKKEEKQNKRSRYFSCLNFCNFGLHQQDQIVEVESMNQSKKKEKNKSIILNSEDNKIKQKIYQSIICGHCSTNDHQIESEDKNLQQLGSDRILFKASMENPQSFSEKEKENEGRESEISPKFYSITKNIEDSQFEKDDEAEVSTKKESDQKNTKLIIRAKDSSILSEYYNKSNINLNNLKIPFDIVKLSMSKSLVEGLNLYYPQFLEKYGSKYSPRACNWRMLQNGTYTNILENLHGVFITHDLFYEGYFIENSKTSFSPDQKGIVINKQYVYDGQFLAGKANGHGKLTSRSNKDIFQGTWQEGLLVIGTIYKQNITFTGQFYQSEPYGLGELKITNKNIVYKGKFDRGVFEDPDAVYQCQKYWYKGGFKNGRKNGKGVLLHKIKNIKIQGYWTEDQIKKPLITSAKEF